MRAPVVAAAATALLACIACTNRTRLQLPNTDGDGPVGGVPGSGSSSGSGGSSGSSSGSQPPSQPGGGDDTGDDGGVTVQAPGDDAGSGASEGGTIDAGAGDAGPPDAHGGDAGGTTALLAECVQQINQIRSQAGVDPYQEAPDLETYAATAAASDAQSGTRHGYFYDTNGGGGVAATENELDGAQVDPGGGAEQTLVQGLGGSVQAQGQAYSNLVNQQLTQVGCGFAQDSIGSWWIVIALR